MKNTKQCSKCQLVLPITCFHKDCTTTDNLYPSCKKCKSIYTKKYRNEYKEKIAVRKKNFAQKNKNKINAYNKMWSKNNPEKAKQYRKAWASKNREKVNQRQRNWRKNNPDKAHEQDTKKKSLRRRDLGFNKLIENDWNEPIHWHHVNDNDVVPIPAYLHQMCYSPNREMHRKLCSKLINILYENELKL